MTLLLEGMSVRAISRITGAHQGTILSLLLTVGKKCRNLFDKVCAASIRDLCKRTNCGRSFTRRKSISVGRSE